MYSKSTGFSIRQFHSGSATYRQSDAGHVLHVSDPGYCADGDVREIKCDPT